MITVITDTGDHMLLLGKHHKEVIVSNNHYPLMTQLYDKIFCFKKSLTIMSLSHGICKNKINRALGHLCAHIG